MNSLYLFTFISNNISSASEDIIYSILKLLRAEKSWMECAGGVLTCIYIYNYKYLILNFFLKYLNDLLALTSTVD